jgi:hypothetical protein
MVGKLRAFCLPCRELRPQRLILLGSDGPIDQN